MSLAIAYRSLRAFVIGAFVRAIATGLAIALCSAAWSPTGAYAHEVDTLERVPSHAALLRESGRDAAVVVALFSLAGCPYCEAIRRDQLRHLAHDAQIRQLRVVEYDINDRQPFESSASRDAAPASPADLARTLGVRIAPTVVFLGPDGKELAERLVGYSSPDFYGAYLDQRIAKAREQLGAR